MIPSPSGTSQITDTPLPAKSGWGCGVSLSELLAARQVGRASRAVDVIASGCNDADWLGDVEPAERAVSTASGGFDVISNAAECTAVSTAPEAADAERTEC